MDEENSLEKLVLAVQANPKYRSIDSSLIRSVGQTELTQRKNFKEAVKATRNKLHQVGGAYQEGGIDYTRWSTELANLPNNPVNPALQDFCRQVMAQHASTRERLPILERFYFEVMESLSPVKTILDLACGLNPFALPWMPLAPGAQYFACDIYQDMIALVNQFLLHLNQPGEAGIVNLVEVVPSQKVQLALLLKVIPCLEQLDKNIAPRLLDAIHAKHFIISYPVHSLGGQSKGMLNNYEEHFRQLAEGRNWTIQRYVFPSELVFLASTKPE